MFESVDRIVMNEEKSNKTRHVIFRSIPKEYTALEAKRGPTTCRKAEYGKSETKKAIANVLDKVLNDYKFTTMGELNAVLNQYNVAADIRSAGSRESGC
jgi:hypothetical protein